MEGGRGTGGGGDGENITKIALFDITIWTILYYYD